MAFDIGKLGMPYFSLEAAQVDKSPSEIVILDKKSEKYYIVNPDVFEAGPEKEGFEIVINEGE